MSNISLYTEMKLALDNEVNMKLLASIPDIAVIVLGTNSVHLLECLFGVYDELGLPIENIRRIVICDRDVFKAKRRYADSEVSPLSEYHGVNVKFVSSIENNYPPSLLTVVMSSKLGKASLDGVYAYGIALTVAHEFDMSSTRTSMISLTFEKESEPAKKTPLCETRMKNYAAWKEDSFDLEMLLYALQELKNNCEDCNQCSSYGSARVCPFFQLKIAELYESGQGVCENHPLALEWKKKAIRQGFPEAKKSLARTYMEGKSPEKNFDEILSMLDQHAKTGDRDAVNSIIGFLQRCGKEALALPWYARLANDGDFSAQNKLIDFYSSGQYGIPSDEKEEKAWTDIALMWGNQGFISSIVESSIERNDWASAFKWYNRLRNEGDFDEDKLVDIFSRYCESENLTARQYVEKGDQYFYGIDVEEEPTLAYMCYEKAEEMGELLGTEGLGRCYFHGKGVEKDKTKAVDEYFTPAADEGDFRSMVHLFDYYHADQKDEEMADYWKRAAEIALDDAVERDDAVAMRLKSLKMKRGEMYERDHPVSFELMKRASEKGDVPALFHLGEHYCHGLGVPKDMERAFKLFDESASRGLVNSLWCVACCYKRGLYVARNPQKAFESYSKAAVRGDVRSYVKVAEAYEEGDGVKASLLEANKWYLKAAEEGNATAQEKIGENYYFGKGIEKSLSEAKKWSVKAAEQGNSGAFFRAAYLCTLKIEGITEYDKAFKWYSTLAEKGNAAAQNNLGVMYDRGRGVPMDKVKASELFLQSAQGGDSVAMANIAYQFIHGEGVDVDLEQAVSWYEQGLQKGSIKCGIDLADEYISGEHLEKNIPKGIETYNKVIELPHPDDNSKKYYVKALMALADLYYFGKDDELEEDNEKAFHLFRKAAEEGNDLAYFRLGTMYHYGYYVGKDINQAIYWYRLAAEKENEDAIKRLEKIDPDWVRDHPIEHPDDADDLPF